MKNEELETLTVLLDQNKNAIMQLKSFFDTALISRSQAKRICNRLEQFEEVILDFDEIEWMGQGFAHQIFVVFPKNNTKTRLIVKNMSENVKKMYDHVIYTD